MKKLARRVAGAGNWKTSSDGFDFQPMPARTYDANPPARDFITTLRPRAPQFTVHQNRPLWPQSLQDDADPPLQTQRPARAFLMTRHRGQDRARDHETRAEQQEDESKG
ncbi:MAG TPA: hypothetical protein VGA87_09605 [Pyrinomonadaceae bacterium]